MPKSSKDIADKMRKTTIRLPESLWKESRIHGITEGVDFQDMVAEGLKLYLKKSKGKKLGRDKK